MLITEGYRALNQTMHATKSYGISGAQWARKAHELATLVGAQTLLDYGCGRGLLKQELEDAYEPQYSIMEYDPAIEGKTWKPARADVVVCGDVLEHIEPDCLYSVLDDIHKIARCAVLLVISTSPAKKHLPDGRNAHLIVEPVVWWMPKLMERWKIGQLHEANAGFYCIGTPR
jgi:2-polyprenyl-3-methyl-5-hydroxy-6-metoxy-1,4-benzoquinol methylase